MNIDFTVHGQADFSYWIEIDKDTAIKIKELIKELSKIHLEDWVKSNRLNMG